MVRSIVLALLFVTPSLAHADQKAADACAGSLSGDAKVIYQAAAPDFPAAPDPRAEVKAKVEALVLQGKIDRGSARGNAMAAGACLKKLR